MRSFAFGVAVLTFLGLSIAGRFQGGIAAAADGSTLSRPEDPVVLTGTDIPTLTGMAPHDLVAFRYDSAWTQIPVQVDERDVKTFTTVYNGVVTSPVTELFYTDPNTWTGADGTLLAYPLAKLFGLLPQQRARERARAGLRTAATPSRAARRAGRRARAR